MATLKYKDSQGNIKTARVAVTTKVPPLDNPATTDDVVSGKEFIDENGEKRTGIKQDVVDWLPYASSVAFNATFLSEEITMHLEGCTTLANTFRYAEGVKNLTVYVGQPTSLLRFVGNSSSITKVKIVGDLSACTTYSNCFNYETIEEIDADIDFSSVTSSSRSDMLVYPTNTLTKVRFVANTLSVSMYLESTVLNDGSLVSLANACKTGIAETLTWSDESKTRASLIMGTVSQITKDDVTYDFFTEDENGTVSLMSFITQTKGWTLA